MSSKKHSKEFKVSRVMPSNKEDTVSYCYQNLCNAIVAQACEDYINLKIKGRFPGRTRVDSTSGNIEMNKILRFMGSEWYQTLTTVSSEYLLRRCDERVEILIEQGVSNVRYNHLQRVKYGY